MSYKTSRTTLWKESREISKFVLLCNRRISRKALTVIFISIINILVKNINSSSKFVFSSFRLILYFLNVLFRSTDVFRATFLIETILRDCFWATCFVETVFRDCFWTVCLIEIVLRDCFWATFDWVALFTSVCREIFWVMIITMIV